MKRIISDPRLYRLLVLFVVLCLSLASCTAAVDHREDKPTDTAAAEAFDALCSDIVIELVGTDTLSIHYSMVNPEDYGIKRLDPPTFGDFTRDTFIKEIEYFHEAYNKLIAIKPDGLGWERKLAYDVLVNYLTPDDNDVRNIDFAEPLSPTLGIQSNLPIELSEYRIENMVDLEEYLGLLADLPRYFSQLADFEAEKKSAGTFMSKSVADEVINQIEDLIVSKEDNFLISGFASRIEPLGLSKDVNERMIQRNKDLILGSYIPAYEALLTKFKALNQGNTRDSGLFGLEGGTSYYAVLAKDKTGTELSVEAIDTLIDNSIVGIIQKFSSASSEDLDKLDALVWPETKPDKILDYLRDAVSSYYPSAEGQKYLLHDVDPSLEDYLSPAFFFTPPIDSKGANSIYINNKSITDESDLFTTLAHEGFPGHLYQFAIYKNTPHPAIRDVLNFGAYTEGWATYAENNSGILAGMGDKVNELLGANRMFSLLFMAKIDIGVNYYGWGKKEVGDYCRTMINVTDPTQIAELINQVTADPANVMQYAIGAVKFQELKTQAQNKKGSSFDPVKYHEFLLSLGPAPFSVLEDMLARY